MNQCEGCKRGLPVSKGSAINQGETFDMHYDPETKMPVMVCTKDRYEEGV